MTEIDSTPSNDTHLSHFDLKRPEHEDRGRVNDIVISEGHKQPGLAAYGNFHSTESNVTFNTSQENEASNTNADSKQPAPSTPMQPLSAPSRIPGSNTGGPSTPIVKKASVYNVLLVNALKTII